MLNDFLLHALRPPHHASAVNILRAAADLRAAPRRVCVAIGFLDGVHLGHQHVLRQMVADARQHEALAVAVTFDRHPNSVVAPARTPPLVYSLPQKLRAIEALGADAALVIPFDRAFSEQSGEAFIRGLARDFGHIHSICVGASFTFGHRRGGNVDLLRALGRELKFLVHGLAAVSLDGDVVSSTRIREAIRAGNLDAASQMLGRAYALAGEVVRGDGVGHKLGFPTANLDTTGVALPPNGVYAAHAFVERREHRAVVNIGVRPTVADSPHAQVEAHLLDFDGDVYGAELELAFVEKLRDEQKFESLDALKSQIARDIVSARGLFA
jgi:riboflavin kinase/FMN adenylyltransferase